MSTDTVPVVSSSPEDFRGRRAIVTGAASGIGAEITRGLLTRGAEVIGFDLNTDHIPDGAHRVGVDISSQRDVARACAEASGYGPIDTLFNNAGIGSTKNLIDCEPEEWDRVFAVNVRGIYLVCREIIPGMLERGVGVIVNTASVAGQIGLPERAAYCASKAAVVGLTKQIAVQWAKAGIRCNCVSPGTVDSPWVERLLNEASDPQAHREQLVARQPLGRLGTPNEVATAALYLASDAASFMTGTDLVIDGGITAA
ncbi:MAG: short-chain dehydrogenase [Candidatus Lumbricidophila eiseniae]|uniref:Short-chain dehydrogenase n=1 Tax=Candidatus Lumbricidiphila eiseniae TaxID=1969409 RepID=A0A2A6FUE0_9MICO|nr:MAG: short-chain dehydrogenase [Candidatus Lumbricidophila eiseniae]